MASGEVATWQADEIAGCADRRRLSRSWLPRLSSAWMRLSLAPALVFIATATDQGFLYDFWHHLARGRAMARQGRLVDADLFTFTVPGRTFEDVNWLPQLLYHRLFEWGGLPVIQLLNSIALASMMGVLVHLCWRKSRSTIIAGTLGVFAFFGLWQSFTIRPQTFSFLLFVLLYEVLESFEERPWALAIAPALLALWANLHGAFPAGLVLMGAFLLAACYEGCQRHGWRFLKDRRVQALCACLFASASATLVNPYGWRAYHFVSNTSSVAGGRPIGEWLPPSLDLFVGKFWITSLILIVIAFGFSRNRPTVRETCLVALFLPLAAGSVRMVAWWVLVITPIFARLVAANWSATRASRREKPAFMPAACFALIIVIMFLSIPGLSRFNPLLGSARRAERQTEHQLDEVAAYIKTNATSARIFSRFEWGAYIICALGPAYPVFMDGRIDMYPDEVWAEYTAVTGAQTGWGRVLERRGVNYLLLDANYHAESGLLPEVQRLSHWKLVHNAGEALLFARQPAAASLASR